MPDDPADAFDAFADSIRQKQDELEAADRLRVEREAARRKAADPKKPEEPGKGGEYPRLRPPRQIRLEFPDLAPGTPFRQSTPPPAQGPGDHAQGPSGAAAAAGHPARRPGPARQRGDPLPHAEPARRGGGGGRAHPGAGGGGAPERGEARGV